LLSGNFICIVIELGAESKLALCGPWGVIQLGGMEQHQTDRRTLNLFDVGNDSSYDCSRFGLPVIIALIREEIELHFDVMSEMAVRLLPLQTDMTS
jgi:hypothetical protein